MLRWWKQLSTTDAQQPTSGGIVPYLRATAGSGDDLANIFDGLDWGPGTVKGNPVEKVFALFQITDDGADLGPYELELSFSEDRLKNHDHPALWIHWGPELGPYLREHNRDGWYVVIERNDDAAPPLSITFTQTQPGT